MATTGVFGMTSGVNDASGGGTIAWSNPSRVTASDDSYATASLNDGESSQSINASTPPALGIPAGATINGCIFRVHRKASVSNANRCVQDSEICVVLNSIHGTNKAVATLWPTAEAIATYGTSSDLHGFSAATWALNVQSASFGVIVKALGTDTLTAGPVTASVDYVDVEVFYTAANRRRSVVTRFS